MSDVVACPNCAKKNRVPAAATGVPRCANCKAALPWLTSAGDADFDQVAAENAPTPAKQAHGFLRSRSVRWWTLSESA